jgi:hypothetical protein
MENDTQTQALESHLADVYEAATDAQNALERLKCALLKQNVGSVTSQLTEDVQAHLEGFLHSYRWS